MSVRLKVAADTFLVTVGPGDVTVVRGAGGPADATVCGAVGTLREVIFTKATVASAVRGGELEASGDTALLDRFFACFRLPEPAPAEA